LRDLQQWDIPAHIPNSRNTVGNEQREDAIRLVLTERVDVHVPESSKQKLSSRVYNDCIHGGVLRFDGDIDLILSPTMSTATSNWGEEPVESMTVTCSKSRAEFVWLGGTCPRSAKQKHTHEWSSRVKQKGRTKSKSFQEEKRQKPKAEFR